MKNHSRNNKGFSFIELLIVVIVVGILVAIAHAALNTSLKDARTTKVMVALTRTDEAKIRYYMDTKDPGEPSLTDLATYMEQGQYGGGAEMFYTDAAWLALGNTITIKNTEKLLGGVKGNHVIKPNARNIAATYEAVSP